MSEPTEDASTNAHGEHCCPGHRCADYGPEISCPRGTPIWCPNCASDIGKALDELLDLATDLDTEDGQLLLPPAAAVRQEKTTKGSPSPAPALDLVESLVSWVLVVEDELLEHVGAGRRVFPNLRPLSGPLDTLHRYRSALLSWDTRRHTDERDAWRQAEAVVVGKAILRWQETLTRAAGRDRLVHRLPAPCPACNAMGLSREDGADKVKCGVCRAEWEQDRYEHMVLVLAQRWRTGGRR